VSVFEILGAGGIVVSALAYVPQVIHLAREHCSAGISRRAWAMWLTSSLLVGALAVDRKDVVFIMLQLSTLASASVIVFLAYRYRDMVCEVHAHFTPPASVSVEAVAEEEMVSVQPSTEEATARPV
jgi:PQ loop repeat